MTELPTNHDEALALANMKCRDSNLARCYLARETELAALRARVARLEAALTDAARWIPRSGLPGKAKEAALLVARAGEVPVHE